MDASFRFAFTIYHDCGVSANTRIRFTSFFLIACIWAALLIGAFLVTSIPKYQAEQIIGEAIKACSSRVVCAVQDYAASCGFP